MKKIAIVFGGDSLEHDISIVTALVVNKQISNKNKYIFIYLSRNGEFYYGNALINKNNYSSLKGFKKGYFKRNNNKTYFIGFTKKVEISAVLLCVHGYGVEDGTLGAYFDILKIPVAYSGVLSSSLMQNKSETKHFLNRLGINVTHGVEITYHRYQECNFDISKLIKEFIYPLIIKPVHLGSSIGVYKVKNEDELNSKISEIFELDTELIIEECIENLIEYNVAIVGHLDEMFVSEIEEVNHENKILTFKDKYEEFSLTNQKVIGGEINNEVKEKIIANSLKAFKELSCFGVVRFDYLYDKENNKLYLNEINSIPGSLAYYLFESKGMSFDELLDKIVESAKYRSYLFDKKIRTYSNSNLMSITSKK